MLVGVRVEVGVGMLVGVRVEVGIGVLVDVEVDVWDGVGAGVDALPQAGRLRRSAINSSFAKSLLLSKL
jgi:hypothetical protein